MDARATVFLRDTDMDTYSASGDEILSYQNLQAGLCMLDRGVAKVKTCFVSFICDRNEFWTTVRSVGDLICSIAMRSN